jgi:hypothetical protein
VLTELLLPHPGVGEFRLLAPALVAVQQAQRSVMLFDPPAALCGWALAALGLDMQHLVIVRSRSRLPGRPVRGAGQAPRPARGRCAVGAGAGAQERACRRRAGLAAGAPARRCAAPAATGGAGHDGPAFLVREVEARCRPSAAPLRLLLESSGPDELCAAHAQAARSATGAAAAARAAARCCRARRGSGRCGIASLRWLSLQVSARASSSARPWPGPGLPSIHEPDRPLLRRVAMLWLACFPCCSRSRPMPPRWCRQQREQPVALLADHRIAAANAAARQAGVQPGLKRATALALAPELLLGQADAHARRAGAAGAVPTALAFTPSVTLEGRPGLPDTVLLEVAGQPALLRRALAAAAKLRAALRRWATRCRSPVRPPRWARRCWRAGATTWPGARSHPAAGAAGAAGQRPGVAAGPRP